MWFPAGGNVGGVLAHGSRKREAGYPKVSIGWGNKRQRAGWAGARQDTVFRRSWRDTIGNYCGECYGRDDSERGAEVYRAYCLRFSACIPRNARHHTPKKQIAGNPVTSFQITLVSAILQEEECTFKYTLFWGDETVQDANVGDVIVKAMWS